MWRVRADWAASVAFAIHLWDPGAVLQRNISVECRSGRHPFAGVNRCRWASCAPPHNQVKGEGDEADACASWVFPSNTIGVFTRTVSEIFQGCQGDDARWSHARRRGHRAVLLCRCTPGHIALPGIMRTAFPHARPKEIASRGGHQYQFELGDQLGFAAAHLVSAGVPSS